MDCIGIPEIALGEVSERLVQQLGNRRYPLGGSLELTERCNLNCLMCYINQPAKCRKAMAREMTLPEVKNILDQLVDAGCLSLLITGGEPLLRPDFQDIWRYAKEKGLLVTLFTNGTMLTPPIADFLAEWRPTSIEITLYGATQETYERVTQVPGSYERCIRGIELAFDKGLRLNLKSVIIKANRHELDAVKTYAANLGVSYRFDGVLWPRIDSENRYLDQRLSPSDVVALDEEYPERQKERARQYQKNENFMVRNEHVYTCGAGRRSFHIDKTGKLSVCMMARKSSYDLLNGNFREGWEYLGNVLRQKRTLDTPCRNCTIGVLCTQCPGWSQLVHGDDETPVDYVCEIGHLRATQVQNILRESAQIEPTKEHFVIG